MKDRKLFLAFTGGSVGIVVVLVALVGWWIQKTGAEIILVQGLTFLSGIFLGYITGNIVKTDVISKNYRVELDKDGK